MQLKLKNTPSGGPDQVLRPWREICVREVQRPGEKKQRCWPGHVAYVFKLDRHVAQDEKAVKALRARCDRRAHSWRRGPVECWSFVNKDWVAGYKRGEPLREEEVALLIPTGWRFFNRLKIICKVPRGAFYILP